MSCRYCPGAPIKTCPYCKQCLTHYGCKCVRCQRCEKKFPRTEMCPKCNQCLSHHIMGSYIGEDFPLRPCEYKARPVTTFGINGLRRMIGTEVEVGDMGDLTARSIPPVTNMKFSVEHDGSVQPSGIELVTLPTWGDKWMKGQIAFLKMLTAHNCQMNKTCGYHVHIDGADLSMYELRRLVVMFQFLQDEIFGTLVNKSRANNIYCKRLEYNDADLRSLMKMDAKGIKEWFHNELYGMSLRPNMSANDAKILLNELKQRKSHKYENAARRWALNFHSYMMRGTIEFRLKEGNMNPDDFLLWPLFCGNFVQASLRLTDTEMMDWIKTGPPSLRQFSDRFMPESVRNWVGRLCK